jgi:hypothetical protein
MTQRPRILVLTLVIGADYKKKLAKALESKRAYCARHGYEYIQAEEESWDRTRPISWSKVPLLKKYAAMKDKYDYIWMSDADVYITNLDLKLEDHVLPLLPDNKDFLLTYDSCQHVNAGNVILRPSEWSLTFLDKVWDQKEFLYHIWWETAAICHLMATNPSDMLRIECTRDAYRFNAYLQGVEGARLWQPGDLLVHFAGVYDPVKMAKLMDAIDRGETPRLSMF